MLPDEPLNFVIGGRGGEFVASFPKVKLCFFCKHWSVALGVFTNPKDANRDTCSLVFWALLLALPWPPWNSITLA